MSEDAKNELVEKSKTIIFFVAPYCIALGVLYLGGYWYIFDINILQFAGLADIVASALFPMGFGFASLSIGMILGELYSRKFAPVITSNLPPPDRTRSFFVDYGELLIGLYLCLFLALMMSDWSQKWPLFPLVVACPIAIFLVRKKIVVLPHVSQGNQAVAVYIVVLLLPWAFSRGISDATKISSGESFSYVVSATAGQSADKDRPAETALRFIGHVGDFDFFFDPVSLAVNIAKIQDENLLILRKHVRKSEPSSLRTPLVSGWGWVRRLYLPDNQPQPEVPVK
jgi:hypothetical protein